jgi:hypothetical protein
MEVRMYIRPKRVNVEIKRGITQTNVRAVFEHEIPILEVVHGEGNIRLIEPPYPIGMVEPPQLECPIDARAEYERLCEHYGMHDEVAEPNCENVYGKFGNGRAFAASAGGAVKDEVAQKEIAAFEEAEAKRTAALQQERVRAVRGAA